MKHERKRTNKGEIDRDEFFNDLENAHETKNKILTSGAQLSPKATERISYKEILNTPPYKDNEMRVTTIPTQMRKPRKKGTK